MSGIAGILFCDGQPVERDQLERFVNILSHRGPDGAEMWSDGGVGLVHRMLWTTPESLNEKLPLVSSSGDLAITADARIDNREELATAVGLQGRPLREIGDGELILLAYERWGERCVERLLGDFAFAIWDGRKRELFCARDHMGVRPFYYFSANGVFVFGSEIKAILTVPQVPRRLNETRVADFLVFINNDQEITSFQGIYRLPAAHTLVVREGSVHVHQYWTLDPNHEIRGKSDEEYAEGFREVFTEAVRCRLRSAFPVGSMLSGGLDSSSIVCVARDLLARHGGLPLHTFSAIFDEVPECDERPYIKAVLEGGSLEPHFVRADRISPLADLDRVFWHEEEPFGAPNLYMHWGLYEAANRHGVRVLMDGIDGDSVVSHGYAYLPELLRSLRWASLAVEIARISRNHDVSWQRVLWARTVRPLVPESWVRFYRILRGRDSSGWSVPRAISPNFARRVRLRERYLSLERDWDVPARTARTEHWLRLTWGAFPCTFEVATRAAGAFRVEPTFPYFDRRLVEYCLALPPQQKLYQGWNRVVVRRALAEVLPEHVGWRPKKSNLSANFRRGLLLFEREILERIIYREPEVIEEYADVSALREAYTRYVSSDANTDSVTVWRWVILAQWLRREGFARCAS